jgi:2-methylcitrate dehydratase
MDKITDQLVEFSRAFSIDDVTPRGRQFGLRHLVDAIACSVAGYCTESAQAAVQVARATTAARPATVFGAAYSSAPGYAAMANAVMIRGLDWNDGMLAIGGGHPSDMIPGVIAVGESVGASGRDVLEGVILAYEILGAIGNVANSHPRGWDQGLFMGPAIALAAGRLAGLTPEQLGHAVSLSIVPLAPLLVTRRGALSMWKGAATSVAVMHAINAITLAREGMTGPGEPFSGTAGVFDQLTGPFDLKLPAEPGGSWVVEISHMKQFPAESHGQALLALVPELREWSSVADIESIEIDAYLDLYNAIGRDRQAWDPHNRESADHSLPYLLAVALVDGDIDLNSFTPERIADPALRPVMEKVTIREDTEFSAQYRREGMELAGSPRARIRLRRRDGAQFEREVTYPKGHSRNPMTDADVDTKFVSAARGVVSDEHREQIRTAWWGVEQAERISDATATLADFGAAASHVI